MSTLLESLLAELTQALSPGSVLTGDDIAPRSHADWTQRNACAPAALLRPSSTEEVSTILRRCHAAGQPVVVQGGLTGLAGGATPRPGEVALSLERLTGVESVDPDGGTMLVRAGTPLAIVQAAAEAHGLQFPLDLGARGSCTIGGNISTNAGGNRVIRYGMTRELVLGVEAVLADGTIVSSLNAMLKNNAGYDLKQLFVGTEGTLGVVTRAVLRLHPAPRERLTACVAVDSFGALVALLRECRSALGGQLGSFETMWSDYYEFAVRELRVGARPFDAPHSHYAIVELESSDPPADRDRLEALLSQLMESGVAADVVIAASLDEAGRLWRVRDAAGELISRLSVPMSYDVSMPIARMAAYLADIGVRTASVRGDRPLLVFGHLGDGNLHIVVDLGSVADVEALDAHVYGALAGFGSVSAEHGIGVLKRAWLSTSRQPAEITLMGTLKASLDPRGILNAGRVL